MEHIPKLVSYWVVDKMSIQFGTRRITVHLFQINFRNQSIKKITWKTTFKRHVDIQKREDLRIYQVEFVLKSVDADTTKASFGRPRWTNHEMSRIALEPIYPSFIFRMVYDLKRQQLKLRKMLLIKFLFNL